MGSIGGRNIELACPARKPSAQRAAMCGRARTDVHPIDVHCTTGQYEARGRFGGQDDCKTDSEQSERRFAKFQAGLISSVVRAAKGFKTAMPLLCVFCQIAWRCALMRLFSALRPLAGLSTSIFARVGYLV